MKRIAPIVIFIFILSAVLYYAYYAEKKSNDSKVSTATLHTNYGDITLELYRDEMPITAGNFIKLAREGFYDGLTFHRVIANFMIQGGDPLGNGIGGPGYTIEDEFVPRFSNVRGTISMANTGAPNSGGSQFFINVVDNIGLDFDKEPLSSKHPVFGKVVNGMEVVDIISHVPTDELDKPLVPVLIEKVTIEQ